MFFKSRRIYLTSAGLLLFLPLFISGRESSQESCNLGFVYCSSVQKCLPSFCMEKKVDGTCAGESIDCSRDTCLLNSCLEFITPRPNLEPGVPPENKGEEGPNNSENKREEGQIHSETMREEEQANPDTMKEEGQIDSETLREEEQANSDTMREEGQIDSEIKRERRQTDCKLGEEWCQPLLECLKEGECIIQVCDEEKDEYWCVHQNKCTPRLKCSKKKDALNGTEVKEIFIPVDPELEVQMCPQGQVYCLELGECSPSCGVWVGDDEDEDEPGLIRCQAGEIYCIQTQRCSSDCRVEDWDEDEDEDEYFSNIVSCPPGMIYCMQYKTCIFEDERREDGLNNDDEDDSNELECPHGTVYCFESQNCEENCERPGRALDEEDDDEGSWKSCPAGQSYCLAVQACVTNCDFFNPQDEEEDDEEEQENERCPFGTVYCLDLGRCVPEALGCINATLEEQDPGTCPLGLLRCGTMCAEDCCNEEISPIQPDFSTCILSNHCSQNQSCCRTGGSRYCTSSNISSEETYFTQLENTCSRIPPDLLTVQMCPETPSSCPPLSLCCGGECRGIPLPPPGPGSGSEEDGISSSAGCKRGLEYCETLNLCVDPLAWNCSVSCGPGLTICSEGSTQTCSPPGSSCTGNTSAWTVWMFSEPNVLYHKPVQTVLSQLGENLKKVAENQVYTVLNLSTPDSSSSWEYGTPETGWSKLQPGVNLTSQTFLQLQLSNSSAPGVGFLNLLENPSGIERRVLQTILPDLSPPLVNIPTSGLDVDEDTHKPISISRKMKLNENIDVKQHIVAVQKVYQEWVLLSGSRFLDLHLEPVNNILRFLRSGTRTLGVQIRLVDSVERLSDYKSKLYYSTDGRNVELVTPVSQPILWLKNNPRIQIAPEKDFNGEVVFNIVPVALDWMNRTVFGKPKKIRVQVSPVNDVPVPLDSPGEDVPLVPSQLPQDGFLVRDLAGLYYSDIESTDLGIGIIYAQESDLGTWQYKSEGGEWTDILNMTYYPVPKGLKLQQSFRGVVPVSKYMEKLACSNQKVNVSLTGSADAGCWSRIRSKSCGFRTSGISTIRSLKESIQVEKKKLCKNNNGTKSDCSSDIPEGVAEVSVELETRRTRILLLSNQTRIRFNPTDAQGYWSTFQAMVETRLVFTAWDGEEGEEEGYLDQQLPFCCQCKENGSLATDFALFYIEKADCTGGPVVTKPKELDECGVCGGIGTTCRDCNNVLNGGSVLDCGVCYASAEEAKNKRDCLGTCGGNVIISPNSTGVAVEGVCVPVEVKSFLQCDGEVRSGAWINQCGVCVGGTTGRAAHSGLHECGGCSSAVGVRECGKCGEEKDDCGVCSKPNSPSRNSCKKKFCDLSETNHDILQSTYLSVHLESQEFLTKNYTKPICWLDAGNEKYSIPDISIRGDYLLLGKDDPPLGVFSIVCTLEAENKSETFYSKENQKLQIFNSLLVEVVSVNASYAEDRQRQVYLTVKNIPEDLKLPSITCFFRKKLDLEGGLMGKAVYRKGVVDCGRFLPMGGGEYMFGITLLSYTKAITDLRLSTGESVIISRGPEPVSAVFSSNLDSILVKFNKNIQGKLGCSKIFSENISQLLQGSTCTYKANTLIIILSGQSNISFNNTLTFVKGNQIMEFMSDADFSMEVSGSVSISLPGDMEKVVPVFSLVGSRTVCPAGQIIIKIENVKRFRPENSSIDYTLYKAEENITDLSSLLSPLSADLGVSLLPEQIEYDVVYKLEVQVISQFGIISEPHTIEFVKPSSSNSLSVSVNGPDTLKPDTQLRLQADIVSCNQSGPESSNFRYFWTCPGTGLDLSKKNSRILQLPPGTLQGGRTYNFSVLVISEGSNMTGSGSLEVSVHQLGPLAVTSANKLTFGTGSRVVLDAVLSKDQDNTPGNLKFEWLCRTPDGNGCFKQNSSLRLEETLAVGTLNKSYVTLPSNTLVPGRYNMTVVVEKNGLNSTASVEVEIVSWNPPTISPISMATRYNPRERITINALINGSAGTCVQWSSVAQDGFSFLEDLQLYTKSAASQCFNRDTAVREFPLDLPAPSFKFKGLQGGARYKFKVIASHPTAGNAEATVEVETLSPPVPGLIQVSPESGLGMKTNFTISAVEFSDTDPPLSYSFGYLDTEIQDTRWLGRQLSRNSIQTLLPASQQGVILVVQVCDIYKACVTTEIPKPVQVSFSELTAAEIVSLGETGANLASSGACIEALVYLDKLIQTVENSAVQTENYKPVLCQFYSDIFLECSSKYISLADCSNKDEGLELMNNMLSSTCLLTEDAYDSGESLSVRIQEVEITCSQVELRSSSVLVERIGFVFSAGLSNGRDPDILFSTRRRRSVLNNLMSALARRLTPAQIETCLRVSVRSLKASGFSSNRGSRSGFPFANQTQPFWNQTELARNQTQPEFNQTSPGFMAPQAGEKIRQKLRDLMSTIHGVYMAEMCKGSNSQSPPETVTTDDVSITVRRTEMTGGPDEIYHFDSNEDYGSSKIVLKDTVYRNFSEWNCGKTSPNGDPLPCVGLCLGTSVLNEDFVTQTSDTFTTSPPQLVSRIHDVRLLNPVNGADLTGEMQLKKAVLDDPLSLQLDIGTARSTEEYTFKCGIFMDDRWTDAYCDTKDITTFDDGTALVNCDCSLPGYISVYLVQKTTNKPLLQMPETYAFNKPIQFKIKENYNDKVGTRKPEFIENLRTQLAYRIGTSQANIKNLNIWPGSIEVSFNLIAPTALEAGQQEQAYQSFSQLLADGKLSINDLAGNPMYVPQQCVDNCAVQAIGDDVIPIVIAAVAMAIVLFILVFIICAVCMKKKKTEEKMKPFTPPSQQPTYRSFQFADNLEGTGTRNRKLTGDIPDYMPSNFNSRNQTAASIQLTEEDSWGVPYAANYTEPSNEEISRSQQIPDHIIRQQRASFLPGTPE